MKARGFQIGKPVHLPEFPKGNIAYITEFKIDKDKGVILHLQFESMMWKFDEWVEWDRIEKLDETNP